jgi:putative endonuclease
VYVLFSERDTKNYVGYTHNLDLRFEQHKKGLVPATKDRRALKLIYLEACLNQQDATRRENYFKTHYGKIYLKNGLANWNGEVKSNFTGLTP